MRVRGSTETLVSTNRTAQHRVLGARNVNIHLPENFRTDRISRFPCGIRRRTQSVLPILNAARQQPGFRHVAVLKARYACFSYLYHNIQQLTV